MTGFRSFAPIERFRIRLPIGHGDATNGAFSLPSPVAGKLHVIASTGEGWDHVSVSLPSRTPLWSEMEFVKRTFWRPEIVAVQLHVAEADHISFHPHCLHMWAPLEAAIPRPPSWMVA